MAQQQQQQQEQALVSKGYIFSDFYTIYTHIHLTLSLLFVF